MVQKQNCLNTTWNSRSITARCLLLLSRIWPSFTEDLNWKKTGNSLEWLYLVDTLIDNLGLCPSSTKGVEGCGKNLKQSFPHDLIAWVPEQGEIWWITNLKHLKGGFGIQWFPWNWYVSIIKNKYDRTSGKQYHVAQRVQKNTEKFFRNYLALKPQKTSCPCQIISICSTWAVWPGIRRSLLV